MCSVIIPVVDEEPSVFDEVLRRVVAQRPPEIHVIINGPRNHELEAVCERWETQIKWEWTPIADKRNAEAIGLSRTSKEIVVFVDSDTFWTEAGDGTLRELLKPFADPRLGGVTTHQIIRNAKTNVITRFAAWLEAARWLFSIPAQSVFGQVGVLPGRTIAFRREILVRCLDDFLGETLRISDDRAQTMHTIKQGYRTAYQRHALVETLAPVSLAKMFRQQLRWSKGSQHNTLRWLGMMLRRCPFAAFQFLAEMITPFLFIAVVAHAFQRGPASGLFGGEYKAPLISTIIYLPLIVLGWSLNALVRQFPLVRRQPVELLYAPVYAALALIVLIPTRILGLMMANLPIASAWGTRTGAVGKGKGSRFHSVTSLYPAILALGLFVTAILVGIYFR